MPIPALIISGYLGAGKTTLVQHLLDEAQRDGIRLAIISNEFGDTGIDRALMESGEEGFVELDGGCVCCRLSDALGETVEAIVAAARPDRLVLETSGVALPGDVQIQFWRPPISDLVAEEVVVIVVDAERLAATDDDDLEETFLEQVEAADLLLLNKADLVDAATLDACRARLDRLTGGQPVVDATRGHVDASVLFPPDPEGSRSVRRDAHASRGAHTHERFSTRELTFPGEVDAEVVMERVRAEGAVRAKGFVRTAEGVQVIQGVGPRLELTPFDRPIHPDLVGKVVIIHRLPGVDHHHG